MDPEHIDGLLTVTDGFEFTVTTPFADLEQPFTVYMRLYDVVPDGETLIELVVAPVDHKYVPPIGDTIADKFPEDPEQIPILFMALEGIGFTVTIPEPLTLQEFFV